MAEDYVLHDSVCVSVCASVRPCVWGQKVKGQKTVLPQNAIKKTELSNYLLLA